MDKLTIRCIMLVAGVTFIAGGISILSWWVFIFGAVCLINFVVLPHLWKYTEEEEKIKVEEVSE